MVTAKTKIIKKRWRAVYGLGPIKDKFIGELYTASPQDMEGKYITINLAALTNNYSQQYFNVKLLVEKVEGERGLASICGYYMHQAYEKRLVVKRKEKISDSFGVKTKDNIIFVIKPLIVTASKCPKSVETKIRKYARHFYSNKAAEMNYDDFVDAIISSKLQSELKKELSKITPISACEIRRAERVNNFSLIISPEQYKEEFSKRVEKTKEQKEA